MTLRIAQPKSLCSILAFSLVALAPLNAASIDKITVFANGAAVKATGPDSVTITNDSLWVSYTNGADSTGAGGSSTIVQYDLTGNVVKQYVLPGSVDGLKYDAERDLIWALQNQDGNSTLALIPASGNAAYSSYSYAAQSSTRGYDDVAFVDGQIFLSYTNPTGTSDPTIQYVNSMSPIALSTILLQGATGTNLATGDTNAATTQNDPDSLKTTPLGGLMLSSGADGQLIFVDNPRKPNQSVSFLTLIDPNTGSAVSGLDDAVFATTPSGTFYIADTNSNRVLKVDCSDLEPFSLYASVGSLNVVANVDLKTGVITPFVTNLKAPHGLVFVPKFNSLFGR
jgi:hypothetical protein